MDREIENIKLIVELLDYDSETGVLRWKENRGGGARAGDKAGHLGNTGYIRITLGGKRYQAHRLAWLLYYGEWPKDQIDHINRDKEDNRICNLREADYAINQRNRGANKTSHTGIRGITVRDGKYIATIWHKGKQRHIGRFSCINAALSARKAEEDKYWGKNR